MSNGLHVLSRSSLIGCVDECFASAIQLPLFCLNVRTVHKKMLPNVGVRSTDENRVASSNRRIAFGSNIVHTNMMQVLYFLNQEIKP